jgi:hypothetical protein
MTITAKQVRDLLVNVTPERAITTTALALELGGTPTPEDTFNALRKLRQGELSAWSRPAQGGRKAFGRVMPKYMWANYISAATGRVCPHCGGAL